MQPDREDLKQRKQRNAKNVFANVHQCQRRGRDGLRGKMNEIRTWAVAVRIPVARIGIVDVHLRAYVGGVRWKA